MCKNDAYFLMHQIKSAIFRNEELFKKIISGHGIRWLCAKGRKHGMWTTNLRRASGEIDVNLSSFKTLIKVKQVTIISGVFTSRSHHRWWDNACYNISKKSPRVYTTEHGLTGIELPVKKVN